MLAFLASSAAAAGLELTPKAATGPLRNVRLACLALVLNFGLAPLFAWLLTKVLPLAPGHAIGLILLGGAAGAPFLPKLATVAQSPLASAVALMMLLTAGTLLFMPLVLPLMISGLQADAWTIARPLLLFILVPLLAGMLIQCGTTLPAARLARWLGRLSSACLLLLLVLLVTLHFGALLSVIGSGAIFAVVLYLLLLFVCGWMLGGFVRADRGNLALATIARNFGAAFVSAAGSFSDPNVLTMLVVSAIVCLVVCFLAAGWLRRQAPRSPA